MNTTDPVSQAYRCGYKVGHARGILRTIVIVLALWFLWGLVVTLAEGRP